MLEGISQEEITDPVEAAPKPQYREEGVRLASKDGLSLHVHSWLPLLAQDKVIVTIHGLGGHGGYYASSIAPYLAPLGAVIYSPDLRGHGLSHGERGHIEDFSLFQQDVEAVVRWARLKHPGLPLFLLAESMGTSIAINYIAETSPENLPDGLALLACVVAPTITPSVREVARTLWYLARDRRTPVLPITGREELGVRDLAFIQVLKSDALFNRKISVRFLSGMSAYMQKAARRFTALKLPVLFMMGGEDYTVRHRPTRAFFNRIPALDKELHIFPGAYHAILNDPDSAQVRQRLVEWLERQNRNFTCNRPKVVYGKEL